MTAHYATTLDPADADRGGWHEVRHGLGTRDVLVRLMAADGSHLVFSALVADENVLDVRPGFAEDPRPTEPLRLLVIPH